MLFAFLFSCTLFQPKSLNHLLPESRNVQIENFITQYLDASIRMDTKNLMAMSIKPKELKSFLKEIESDLTIGRILVRPSGTESKIRIMVEAPEKNVAEKFAEDIKKLIKSKV